MLLFINTLEHRLQLELELDHCKKNIDRLQGRGLADVISDMRNDLKVLLSLYAPRAWSNRKNHPKSPSPTAAKEDEDGVLEFWGRKLAHYSNQTKVWGTSQNFVSLQWI